MSGMKENREEENNRVIVCIDVFNVPCLNIINIYGPQKITLLYTANSFRGGDITSLLQRLIVLSAIWPAQDME